MGLFFRIGCRNCDFLWLGLAWVVWSIAPVALAGELPGHAHPVGASVEEFLVLARQMNPERAAAALEAEEAEARVQGAGRLPDPMFQFTLDDIEKNAAGLPGRVGMRQFAVQQEIPWWGKRDLQRGLAEAQSRESVGKLAEVELEIGLRIKTAYADYHRVHLSMDQTTDWLAVLRSVVQIARFRYAQGLATQMEVTAAEAERGALDVELVRFGKERGRIRSRLNVLVNRKPDAPVVEHPQLRPLPAREALSYATLFEEAMHKNPALMRARARTEVARQDHQLAEKSWYPDVNVGIGLKQPRDVGMEDRFEAMVGFSVPVQWSVRRAREEATAAKVQAEHALLTSEQLRLDSMLHETLLSLEEAREVEQVTVNTLLPQARIALQSALQGYQNGTTESIAVLDAFQRLKKFQIEWLKTQFEAQVRLAELERLIGRDL